MDTDIEDMFAILSFLRICKMYKNLKRKRPTNILKSAAFDQQKSQNRRFEEHSDHNPKHPQPQTKQKIPQFCSMVQQEKIQEESFDIADEDLDCQENKEIYRSGEKPIIIQEISEVLVGENFQYEISFEVNGQQVVQGNIQPHTDTKYECVEGAEVCLEGNTKTEGVVIENTDEIHTDLFEENNTEICIKETPAEMKKESDQTLPLPPVPKKRRRRRRRGQILEPEQPVEKKPRTRNFGVRPENLNRQKDGFFIKVFRNIKKQDETQFILLTRMKRDVFEKLLKIILKPMSKRVQHIYPEERLSITLLHLAHGTPFDVIAKKYKLGKTTVRNIVLQTCEILYEVLAPIYMAEPNSEDYLKIAKEFKTSCKLPNCVGIVDGKHVALKTPNRLILEEYNLLSLSSLIIVAACDAKYIFRSATVTVEAHQSSFGKSIMSNTLTLPPNGPLEADSTVDLPYYFIGDTTFPLRSNLLGPYAGSNLNDKEVFYNYRLSHGQIVIENTFSILSSTWRVLLTTFDISPLNCETLVLACIVLHNFLIINGEDRWHNSDGTINNELPHNVNEHTEWVNVESVQYKSSLDSISKFGNESNGTGHELRDTLADYFYTDGTIDTHIAHDDGDFF